MRFANGFKIHRVFGTIVHQKNIGAGETFDFSIEKSVLSEQYENKTLFTKGRITGTREDGSPLPVERVPGTHTMTLGVVPSGNFTFTAQEDSEWWCINGPANRLNQRAAQAKIFSLKAGASKTLEVGTKLLVCVGELQIDDTVFGAEKAIELTSNSKTAVALSDCYGFLFA